MNFEKIINHTLIVVSIMFITFVCFQLFSNEREPSYDPWTKGVFRPNLSVLPYNGIDVSQEHGHIDWLSTSMDLYIDFVYVKATEGARFYDLRYHSNVSSAHDYGMLIGSYHTMTSTESIVDQFFNFNKHVDKNAQRLLPMIEVDELNTSEWSAEQVCDSLALFSWLVNEFYGCQPIIRTHQKFFEEVLSDRFADSPLFITGEHASQPKVKNAKALVLWQRDTHGYVNGIYYDVNLDCYAQGYNVEDLMICNYK